MLTSFQTEVVAFLTEGGEIICPECFHNGADFARPIIRYTLDEEQTARNDGLDPEDVWDEAGHSEYCEPAIPCDDCGEVLAQEYHPAECESGEEG